MIHKLDIETMVDYNYKSITVYFIFKDRIPLVYKYVELLDYLDL